MRIFYILVVGMMLSGFLFPVSFSFLPLALSTKIILAGLGAIIWFFESLKKGQLSVSISFIFGFGIALLFSLICFYSADYNHTDDYSYATYFTSFITWLAGGFAVARALKFVHGEAHLRNLTYYLAAVCVFQCVMAQLIDRNVAIASLVDSIFEQGQAFMREKERLYGIGAALDSAGIRFAVVLLFIAAMLGQNKVIRSSRKDIAFLTISFFVILILGNMIARTTTVGGLLGLGYLILTTGTLKFVIKKEFFKFHLVFGTIIILGIAISTYLYQTDQDFYLNLRFAFEGFFNWFETGEFQTDSTDKLNNEMWIWPSDLKTWIIGSGYFGFFIYNTDVGYCRFILYCGLVGFSVFALFFVYHAVLFSQKFYPYRLLFLFLLALTFIIWVKVATDIFFIYAILYFIDRMDQKEEKLIAL